MAPKAQTKKLRNTLIVLVIFCTAFLMIIVNARQKEGIPSIKGLWYYYSKSGNYSEVYFGDSTFLYFSEDNYFVARYSIDDADTLHAVVPSGPLAFKLKFKSTGAFSAQTGYGSTFYTKLPDTSFSKAEWGRIFLMKHGDSLYHKYESDFYYRMDYLRGK